MAEKVQCSVCGNWFSRNGLIGHKRLKHNAESGSEKAVESGSKALETASETAKLQEEVLQKHNEAVLLSEEITAKKAEISGLREALAAAPKAISDFPATEQAEYFRQVWGLASDEEKAKLAESWGIKLAVLEAPAPAVTVAETPAPAPTVSPAPAPRRRYVLTIGGKRIGG